MPCDRVALSPHLLANIFPFHIAFNRNTEIVQIGKVLEQKYPKISVGSQIAEHFQVTRPNIPMEFDAIAKRQKSLFLIQYQHNSMQLKGQMVYDERSECMLFLGSPWVTDLVQLKHLSIDLNDFAIHDPIVDYLFLLQAQNTALADTKQLAEKLTIQRAEISKALEKEKELNELKSRFITTTSHEFRTPLTKILGMTEILEHYSHKWSEDKKRVYFFGIKNNIKYLTQMLDEILLLDLAEAEALELNPSFIDIGEICQDLVKELQTVKGNQHKLKFSNQSIRLQGLLDEKLLRQVLKNLLLNAIKYSSPGSIVNLKLIGHQQEAVFQIEDQGMGILPEDIEFIFEPFHRGKNVENIPGTGLGLTIVKKILCLFGGNSTVKSEVGVGTTFTVSIPLG
ncbi:hypothetical protein F7734_49525 [Scytonema sp. UIC 10036]|uniref:ATP-binding protein n=1 Tax=Scytonema sp. UIC 10036 TaxID=2304196 RepID=UPI0012DA8985|nr:ATP-binding protein [Scytonema sp. UIC 10036]MUG99893.1 hypothetical protein [Scytonema sp. UIC 10036]